MKIRDLFVSIGFDVKDEDLKRLDKGLANTRRLALAVGTGVVALNGLLIGMAKQVAGVGDKAAKTADKLGVGIEALQEMRYAAELSGIAQANFDTGLQRLTRRAAEAAEGTGVAKDALKELGVQITDSNGRIRKSEDLLADIADGMAAIEDPSRRVALAFKLFDTEGVGMVNMLKNGGAALRQMRAEARSLGHIISEEDARNSEKFNDELARARLVVTGIKNAVGAGLLPALTKTMQRFRTWVALNRKLIKSKLDKFMRALLDAMGTLYRIGKAVVVVIADLVELFGGLETVVQAAVWAVGLLLGAMSLAALGNIVAGVGTLISAIRTLGNAGIIANAKIGIIPLLIGAAIAAAIVVLQDIVSYFQGKDSITGLVIEAFEKRFPKSFKVASAVMAFYIQYWKTLFAVIVKVVKWLMHDLPAAFTAMKKKIGEVVDWIDKKFQPMFDMLERFQGWFSSARGRFFSGMEAAEDFLGFGPVNAPAASISNIASRNDVRVSAPVTVQVPEGTPVEAVGPAVAKGVEDGFKRVLKDTAARLEPRVAF